MSRFHSWHGRTILTVAALTILSGAPSAASPSTDVLIVDGGPGVGEPVAELLDGDAASWVGLRSIDSVYWTPENIQGRQFSRGPGAKVTLLAIHRTLPASSADSRALGGELAAARSESSCSLVDSPRVVQACADTSASLVWVSGTVIVVVLGSDQDLVRDIFDRQLDLTPSEGVVLSVDDLRLPNVEQSEGGGLATSIALSLMVTLLTAVFVRRIIGRSERRAPSEHPMAVSFKGADPTQRE